MQQELEENMQKEKEKKMSEHYTEMQISESASAAHFEDPRDLKNEFEIEKQEQTYQQLVNADKNKSKHDSKFIEDQALDFENIQSFIMNQMVLSDAKLLKLIDESKK